MVGLSSTYRFVSNAEYHTLIVMAELSFFRRLTCLQGNSHCDPGQGFLGYAPVTDLFCHRVSLYTMVDYEAHFGCLILVLVSQFHFKSTIEVLIRILQEADDCIVDFSLVSTPRIINRGTLER